MKPTIKIISLALLMTAVTVVQARTLEEYSKVIKREYPVNPDAQVILDNRFGSIHCNNWDKNVVSVEIKITAIAPDDEAAQRVLDRVVIMASGSASQVEVKTMIEEKGTPGKSRLTVDFTLFMPASVNLNLTNKFGDVYLDQLEGKGKFYLSYGNMDVNRLGNSDNLLDIRFGKADVESVKGAVVMLKYSEMQVEYAGSLRLDSKYSNIRGGKVIALNANYEGGTLKLDNSSAVTLKTKFTDIDIESVEQSIDLDIQYGNFDAAEMPAGFSFINILNKYGNVSVGLPESAAYRLEADLRYCDLDLPSGKKKFSFSSSTPTSKNYRGLVGTEDENVKAKVTVKSDYGNVSLE